MMMPERANKTLICSVAFLDIVSYSSKPVAEQIRFKECLNEAISEAIQDIPLNDRVTLDTGDGVALCFFGDPEDALFAVMHCRDILREKEQADPLQMELRIGINLGPVKLVKDINGQPNLIGDAVNVGQRVMSFAHPGQIMVSRSYYEVVSRLSQEYGQLFQYQGMRTDKHVREHEIYEVSLSGGVNAPLPKALHSRRRSDRAVLQVVNDARRDDGRTTQPESSRKSRVKTIVYGVVAFLALVVVLDILFRGGVLSKAQPPQAGAAQQANTGSKQKPEAAGSETASVIAAGDGQAAQDASRQTANEKAGYLSFAISPWGEIYIDGKKKGVSPPLSKLKVSPGKYTVEIKNGDFPGYTETVEVAARKTVKIKHKFH
ncbi:MAG: PEGA domain-containing protein [Gammaproteobacteria bacterium]|nr:MAG: PEGA domain-containing protein [Gammaproteobacteria bacterium]